MADLAVNLTLLTAALLFAAIWSVTRRRRRDAEDRQRRTERTLLLTALAGHSGRATSDDSPVPVADTATLARVVELLEEDRRQRGLLARLVGSPRRAWHTGIRAGARIGRQLGTTADVARHDRADHRAAARELVELHAVDPQQARTLYRAYAEAVDDPAERHTVHAAITAEAGAADEADTEGDVGPIA